MRRIRACAGLAFAFLSSAVAYGQSPPPQIDTNRWTGNTANTQAQGFSQGSPLTLTWGFMATGTPINDSASSGFANANNNLPAFLTGIYPGGQPVYQPIFQSVFDRWGSISGLSYVFEPNDDGVTFTASTAVGQRGSLGVRADLRIGGKALDGAFNVLAYNYFPTVGDMVIDTSDTFYNTTTSGSLRLRNVVAHEHGHGLGMDHVDPIANRHLMEPNFSSAFDGPQFHDILVAQRAYGDALEKTNAGLGNDIVTRATSLGSSFGPGGSRTIGTSATAGPKANMTANNNFVATTSTDFVSIDSSTDTDFYSFSVTNPGQVTILLEALGITYDARPQGQGTAFSFNTLNRVDMALTLFDTNGTTVLSTVDATGLGGNEQIIFNLLAAGTYFVRITGTANADTTTLDTQFYGLTVTLAAVPEPATIALLGGVTLGGTGFWWNRRRKLQKAQDQAI